MNLFKLCCDLTNFWDSIYKENLLGHNLSFYVYCFKKIVINVNAIIHQYLILNYFSGNLKRIKRQINGRNNS